MSQYDLGFLIGWCLFLLVVLIWGIFMVVESIKDDNSNFISYVMANVVTKFSI